MVFVSLEYILIYILFLVVFILILIYLIILLFVKEIIGLFDLFKKGMIIIFFCIIGLLVICWVFLGYLLFSDLYELLIFFLWIFFIFYMVFCFKKFKNYYLNIIIILSVIFI